MYVTQTSQCLLCVPQELCSPTIMDWIIKVVWILLKMAECVKRVDFVQLYERFSAIWHLTSRANSDNKSLIFIIHVVAVP